MKDSKWKWYYIVIHFENVGLPSAKNGEISMSEVDQGWGSLMNFVYLRKGLIFFLSWEFASTVFLFILLVQPILFCGLVVVIIFNSLFLFSLRVFKLFFVPEKLSAFLPKRSISQKQIFEFPFFVIILHVLFLSFKYACHKLFFFTCEFSLEVWYIDCIERGKGCVFIPKLCNSCFLITLIALLYHIPKLSVFAYWEGPEISGSLLWEKRPCYWILQMNSSIPSSTLSSFIEP